MLNRQYLYLRALNPACSMQQFLASPEPPAFFPPVSICAAVLMYESLHSGQEAHDYPKITLSSQETLRNVLPPCCRGFAAQINHFLMEILC